MRIFKILYVTWILVVGNVYYGYGQGVVSRPTNHTNTATKPKDKFKRHTESNQVIYNSEGQMNSDSQHSKSVKDKNIFVAVDEIPSFPGGWIEFHNYLNSNIHYPADAMKSNIQGRVILKVVVEIDGSISNIIVVKGVESSIDKESIRVVSNMPRWAPGKIKGQPVRSYFTIPIDFRLQDKSCDM